MNSPRDHLSTLRWRLGNGRVRVSNAWHRAAGRRIHGARIGISNWRNRRTLERGRASRITGTRAAIGSRTPVYRSRVNPATGRPHRDDVRLHRAANEGLARMKADRARWPGSESAPADRACVRAVGLRDIADGRVPSRRQPRTRAGRSR